MLLSLKRMRLVDNEVISNETTQPMSHLLYVSDKFNPLPFIYVSFLEGCTAMSCNDQNN